MQRQVFAEVKEKIPREIMNRDSNLKLICDEIANNVPVESMILCGSHATNQVTDASDYDLLVVMKTYLIPFYFSKLKKIEKKLSQELGINATINPLSTFRVKRAKGNLFLFKIKREGITLYGRDYIKNLNPGEIREIPADRYFSFLFSAAKDLIQNFDPGFLKEKPDYEEDKILYDAAKAIIYCAELRLLLNGYYETKTEDLISRLSKGETDNFLNDLKEAINIKNGHLDFGLNIVNFWFRARKYIIETFRILMRNFMDPNKGDTEVLIQQYLNRRKGFSIKNLEYFFLVFLIKKQVYWRALFTNNSVEDRMRMALLYLLVSVGKDVSIGGGKLDKAYEILEGFITFPYTISINEAWKNINIGVCNYWPYACTVMGV